METETDREGRERYEKRVVRLKFLYLVRRLALQLTLVRWKVWSAWMRAMASVAPLNP